MEARHNEQVRKCSLAITCTTVLFCRREDKRKCSSDMLNAEAEECRGCSEVCSHGGCTGKVNEQLILIQGQGHTSHCCVYCYGISYFKKLPVISTAYKRARERCFGMYTHVWLVACKAHTRKLLIIKGQPVARQTFHYLYQTHE